MDLLLKSGRREESGLEEELDDELEDEDAKASEIDVLVDTHVVDLLLHPTFRRHLAMAPTTSFTALDMLENIHKKTLRRHASSALYFYPAAQNVDHALFLLFVGTESVRSPQ